MLLWGTDIYNKLTQRPTSHSRQCHLIFRKKVFILRELHLLTASSHQTGRCFHTTFDVDPCLTSEWSMPAPRSKKKAMRRRKKWYTRPLQGSYDARNVRTQYNINCFNNEYSKTLARHCQPKYESLEAFPFGINEIKLTINFHRLEQIWWNRRWRINMALSWLRMHASQTQQYRKSEETRTIIIVS